MTLSLPPIESLEDVQFALAQIAQQFPIGVQQFSTTLLDQAGVTGGGVTRSGAANIPGAQSTSSTSYVTLTTPDQVSGVVLPTNGLLMVGYQAIWQNTVASNARAAIFLNTNQLKTANGASAPIVAEVNGPAEVNDDGFVTSHVWNGLTSGGGVGAATEVTTGMTIQQGTGAGGGPTFIWAAAGTYDIAVKFKNNAAGTLTVKNRHLWVRAWSF